MSEGRQHSRLPRNFHKTFKPERQYIARMLRFASSGGSADYQGIAAATGIPTGASTGKVPAILDYCRGMGLVRLKASERSSVKTPELTAFGRVVLLDDPSLKLEVSQWIAHLQLCSPVSGADLWYHAFFQGADALGMTFGRKQLDDHLRLAYGLAQSGLIGPLIRTYDDEASFKACAALSEVSANVQRRRAPITPDLAWGYGAWTLQLMQTHFPGARQVSITDLDREGGWRKIPGWDHESAVHVLEVMGRKGVVDVDRHMEPWLIASGVDSEEAWKHIYDDQI